MGDDNARHDTTVASHGSCARCVGEGARHEVAGCPTARGKTAAGQSGDSIETQYRDCKDPREHVYALSEMAPGLGKLHPLDYRKAPTDVFYWLRFSIFRQQGDVFILFNCFCLPEDRLAHNGTGTHCCPSWVPDLGRPFIEFDTPHPYKYQKSHPLRFAASTYRGTLRCSDDNRILLVPGFAVRACRVILRFRGRRSGHLQSGPGPLGSVPRPGTARTGRGVERDEMGRSLVSGRRTVMDRALALRAATCSAGTDSVCRWVY